MTEEETRKAAQKRALTAAPTGALMTNTYLNRTQEVIPVNRNDLEDLMTFDGLEAGLCGVGLFFLSGGLWLGIDKWFDMPRDPVLLILCGAAIVLGAVFFGVGIFMGVKKRGRIARIYNETKAV